MMKPKNSPVEYANKIRNTDIQLFDGRPDRDYIITKDDIINLKIGLNSEISLEELISSI